MAGQRKKMRKNNGWWIEKHGWLGAWIEKIDGWLEGRITNMKMVGWI